MYNETRTTGSYCWSGNIGTETTTLNNNNVNRCHCHLNFDSLIPSCGVRGSTSYSSTPRQSSFIFALQHRKTPKFFCWKDEILRIQEVFCEGLWKWVCRRVREEWRGGFISFVPTGLVSITCVRGTSTSKTMSSEASRTNPFPKWRYILFHFIIKFHLFFFFFVGLLWRILVVCCSFDQVEWIRIECCLIRGFVAGFYVLIFVLMLSASKRFL